MRTAFRAADAWLSMSHVDGTSVGMLEAMAAGLPVVSTPSGGPEALVRESGGGIVLSGFSVEELAAGIRGLLDNRIRLAELRRSGREYVERKHSPGRLRELLAKELA